MALPKRMIEAMCPQRVCTVCGKPSERIAETVNTITAAAPAHDPTQRRANATDTNAWKQLTGATSSDVRTLGWTDCACECGACESCDPPVVPAYIPKPCSGKWRTGVVLDPFAGSGTTLEAAQAVGRHAIGIDLDQRNATLAQQRVGMFMEVAS